MFCVTILVSSTRDVPLLSTSGDGSSSRSRSKGCSANDVCNASKAIPSEHSVATIKGAEDTNGSTGAPDERRLAREGFRRAAEDDADADGIQTKTTMAETTAATTTFRRQRNEIISLYCEVGIVFCLVFQWLRDSDEVWVCWFLPWVGNAATRYAHEHAQWLSELLL